MRAQFEKVTFGGSSFLIFERVDQEFPLYWHYHPEFQLTLMVDSQGQRLVGDGVGDYGPGDLVLLGPNLPHGWRTALRGNSQRHRAVDIQFGSNFFGKDFFRMEEMKPIVNLLNRSSCGLAFGHTRAGRSAASQVAELPSLCPSRRLLSILNILMDLALEKEAAPLSSAGTPLDCRVEDQRRIEAICAFLKAHFHEDLDFNLVARKFNMDQASLCRFFRRATGTTMTHYVNEIRVGAAAQMLTQTDRSVLDISFSVGFGNYSNFNRQFKRIKGHGARSLRQQFLSRASSASGNARVTSPS